jgi:PXA domain
LFVRWNLYAQLTLGNAIKHTFYYTCILVAIIVIYAITKAISSWTTRRQEKSESHFFQSKTEAYNSVKLGRPVRQFPLSNKNGWETYLEKRKNEMVIPRRVEYMPTVSAQKAIDDIISYVSRDFLQSWYKHISTDPTFIARIELLLHSILADLVHRVGKVDFTHFILARLFPLLTTHIKDFKNAEALVRGSNKRYAPTDPIQDELQLTKHYRAGKMHPAVKGQIEQTKNQECEHLRETIIKLLPSILPKAESASRLTSILLREVICCAILQPVVETFSDPDYLNQTFETAIDNISQEFQQEYI